MGPESPWQQRMRPNELHPWRMAPGSPAYLSVWIATVPAAWQGPLQGGPRLGRGDGSSLCSSHPGPCGVVCNSSQHRRDKEYPKRSHSLIVGHGISLPQQTNKQTTLPLKHTHTHTILAWLKCHLLQEAFPECLSFPALFCHCTWFVPQGCFLAQLVPEWTQPSTYQICFIPGDKLLQDRYTPTFLFEGSSA